ncbi:hypothetical protein DS885_03730, partial [Psychromonas sp. B3M02]|uniref:hypothetical protein n=1 Tax=Psychromonas sp. B3M02 TaxID=2267226 RepID=UPI000E042177
ASTASYFPVAADKAFGDACPLRGANYRDGGNDCKLFLAIFYLTKFACRVFEQLPNNLSKKRASHFKLG